MNLVQALGMAKLFLLGLGSLDSGDIESILVLAALEHTVWESIECFFLAVELAEIEPESNSTLFILCVSRGEQTHNSSIHRHICHYGRETLFEILEQQGNDRIVLRSVSMLLPVIISPRNVPLFILGLCLHINLEIDGEYQYQGILSYRNTRTTSRLIYAYLTLNKDRHLFKLRLSKCVTSIDEKLYREYRDRL